MSSGLRRAWCLGGLLLCGSSPAQQSVPTPSQQTVPGPQQHAVDPASPVTTLRITTRTVEISAVVRNRTGEPQGELTKDDFTLKADGKEQPIRYFSVGSNLPLTLALLVDVSGSQRTFIGDEWRASDVFFESMLTRPEDRAMLVQIDARVMQLMGLTNSVPHLHLALTQLGDNTAAANATRLNDSVYNIAEKVLAKEKGRKAIILLTDGGDNGSRASLDQAIEQAQRANVPVYAILYSAYTGPNGVSFGLPGGGGDPGEALLKKLADATGGHVYTVQRGFTLKRIYEAIATDLRTQYQLGYTPPPDLKANSFHKLELKAKDKKLVVQARSGFYVQP